ncbi:MAG: fatty-acid synthase [Acidobacteria bacterium]|nr:fatty-acid synthase [Acidobacteriota bacterium]
MAAKDLYHEHVKTALEKDGWTITHDPYRLKWRGRKKMLIDLAAEKLLLAEKGTSKIAIEVKSFVRTSSLEDLYNAVGQFILYRKALRKTEPARDLYLAIRQSVYDDLFDDPNEDSLVLEDGIKIIVFAPETMEIVLWIPPITN